MAELEMQQQKGGGKGSSTQHFLLISEVRSDAIVTKDGGLRAVIVVSSTNFVLKSPDEQQAIIARYQSFLNALDFPLQILIQSRRLDIKGYLEKLREFQMQQANELLRVQTEEYIEYVSKLLELGNIMSKIFLVIVPYAGGIVTKQGLVKKVVGFFSPAQELYMENERFMQNLGVLNDRVGRVQNGLSSMSLRTLRLNSQELVELIYNSYNLTAVHSDIITAQTAIRTSP
ncbi:MAG: hypothetical protein HY397_02750 [Candidatus Doudnabacteria bacterium]|nr:hypothetical protein [Candidatus Doudnabacteria bacterium]